MINWLISIMLHKKLISQEEAEKLASELPKKTHPQNFHEAHDIVEKVLKDVKKV